MVIFATWDVYAVNNCTGATYYDSASDTCISCPAGYDYNTDAGKTSINQCQTHCAAGTYVENILPSGYTRLEYISATGTQYINTNLAGFNTGNPEFYVKWMRTANSTVDYEILFRVYMGEDYNTYRIISSTTSYPTTYLISPNNKASGGNASAVLANNVIHTGIVRNNWALIDGIQYTTSVKGTSLSSSQVLSIFGVGSMNFHGRIYMLKVRKNGVLFADFVPARRNSDGVLGLYDTVNNVFYTNNGSGTFGAGPVVACSDVGAGHWVASSVVNYGTTGSFNLCPAGTYSSSFNAISLSDCQTCTGATYSGSASPACYACPYGYDYNTDSGKTSIDQCRTQCAAGTYVESVLPSGYTRLEYIAGTGTQYINTNLSGFNTGKDEFYVKWMSTSNPTKNYEGVFSVYQGEHYNSYRVITSTTANTTYKIITPNTKAGGGNIGMHLDNNVIHTTTVGNKWAIIDGIEYKNFTSALTLPASVKLKILAHYSQPFHGRIYTLKVRRDGMLIADFVPARRNSDNVVGMYDAVNNVFYGNSGSGTFGAGPVVNINPCVDTWFGNWAPSSVVNYGTTGSFNSCPEGTYSDSFGAASLSDCQSCIGATYSGAHARVCTECPAGYNYNTSSGKTSATQCQITCDGGSFVSQYTRVEYLQSSGTQDIITNLSGFDTTDWVISARWMLTGSSYNNKYAWVFGVHKSEEHNSYRIITNQGSTTGYFLNGNSKSGNGSASFSGISANTIHYGSVRSGKVEIDNSESNTITQGLVLPAEQKLRMFLYFVGRIYLLTATKSGVLKMNLIPVRRNSDGVLGMYDTITGTFYTNSGTGSFTAGPNVSGAYSGLCTDVSPGYWSAGSITNYGDTGTRNACPVGTTTVGFGHGADEASDCGPALHIGEHVIYMRSNRQTTPSLNIKTLCSIK